MDATTEVLAPGGAPLERYALLTGRTFPDTLLRAARGVVRRAIGITPPANDPGRDGAATSQDLARGKTAISRDLRNLFFGIRRGIGPRGQDPAPIHARLFKRYKKPGRRLARDQALHYWVDQLKARALERTLHARIGRLASGWLPAAQALKLSVPAWISRHGTSRGAIEMDLTGRALSVSAYNYAPNVPAVVTAEVQRRIPYALQYQAAAMQRELDVLLLRDATKAGLQVS